MCVTHFRHDEQYFHITLSAMQIINYRNNSIK